MKIPISELFDEQEKVIHAKHKEDAPYLIGSFILMILGILFLVEWACKGVMYLMDKGVIN